jgi:hypothetical protein
MKIQGMYNTLIVEVDGKVLSPLPSQKLYNHSPDGFMWGYGGSGPAQLALALLLEVTTPEKAQRYYQDLKSDFVAQLPQTDFEVEFDIKNWLDKKEKESL